jgi:hypothetical protein
MSESHDRLLVRFNDEKSYRPAKLARINYENEDYFYITWAASDDVTIDSKFVRNEVKSKALDPKLWNIENRDKVHYVKVSIDNRIWIIEKWIKGKDEATTIHSLVLCDSATNCNKIAIGKY